MIEGRQATGSCARYRAHTHPTLSVGIVDAGQSTLRLSHRAISLQGGDAVVIPPGQVHSCNPRPDQAWSYRMFYLDAVWARGFVGRNTPDQVWPQGVISGPAGSRLIDRIERALRATGAANQRQATIGRCLRELFRLCPEKDRATEPPVNAYLCAARDFLEAHCLEPIPLIHLAQMAGLSPFQLIRRFRNEFGLTPHAYQLDRRINRTRELLQQGYSLADLACLCGFSDQSHFQRAFKLRVAATPIQYRTSPPVKSRRPR